MKTQKDGISRKQKILNVIDFMQNVSEMDKGFTVERFVTDIAAYLGYIKPCGEVVGAE